LLLTTPEKKLLIFSFSFSSSIQLIILELDQSLRTNVEQVINTGKRLYSTDNKDSSGVESAGMYQGKCRKRKRGRPLPFIVLSLQYDLL
jgi:hypothetical protein